MKCPVCKKEVPQESVICPECKARIGLVCYKCKAVNRLNTLRCKKCDAEILRLCPNCRTINLPTADKCRKCNAPLQASAAKPGTCACSGNSAAAGKNQTDTARGH